MAVRVMIMAGGTGGHVFPALAVAEALRGRGAHVVWLGTRRGLEARVVATAGFDMEWVTIAGLRGKGLLSWFLAPLRVAAAMAQAFIAMRRRRPAAVLGMGGFVSGPGGLVAWLMRIPLLVHEQNAIAGLTNRWLARLATQVLAAFPRAFPSRVSATITGNPVRGSIGALAPPERRWEGREGPLRLLVLGGSLGAQRLNEVVPEALAGLGPTTGVVEVRHQTGERHVIDTRTRYQRLGVAGQVTPFIEDMAAAYGWADLVLCRAGALTVAELAAAGVAAIFVPYPFAVDDHQTRNAAQLVDAKAARLLPQEALTPEALVSAIGEICGVDLARVAESLTTARQRLLTMAIAARHHAIPDADARIATLCLEAARG